MCFDPISMAATLKAATVAVGTTLGGVGTAATVGAGAITAYSQVKNMRSQAAAASATAAAQDEAARQAVEQGEQESDRLRTRSSVAEGENIAAMAAQGVDVNSAQAIDILDDNRFLAEEDAFTIRSNAGRRADQFSQSAANSRSQARTARSNAIWQPVSTILTTGARVGSKYASWAAPEEAY